MDEHLKVAIEKMKNGEEEGFNKVYSETYNRVYFRAKNLLRNEEDAQDLVQIVFVEAYKCISTLQSSEALYSWLEGITYRQAMKVFRKKKEVLLTEEAEGLFDTLENNDTSTMPELTADQKATSSIIMGIIEELPELQKTAVVAYYFDSFKVEQIAEMMECSVNTIKSRLNYARKYIKERVEEKERKEGYTLHVFGLPVLWFAIKSLSEETTLTVQAAQGIYNSCCVSVGLQAAALGMTSAGAAASGTATGAAGTTAGASTAGTTAASGMAEAVGGAAKAAGIGAKIAALGTTAKIGLMATAIVAAGTVAGGGAYVVDTKILSPAAESQQAVEAGTENTAEDLSQLFGLYKSDEEGTVIKENPLYATKVSDTEYRFYRKDLSRAFANHEYVNFVSELPEGYEIVSMRQEKENIEYADDIEAEAGGFIAFNVNTREDLVIEISMDQASTEAGDAKEIAENAENAAGTEDSTQALEQGNGTAGTAGTSVAEAVDAEPLVLSKEDQEQISAFVGIAYIYEYDFSNISSGKPLRDGYSDAETCLSMIMEYCDGVSEKEELPYNWYNWNVTKQEMNDFCLYGLGIEIPSNFSYRCGFKYTDTNEEYAYVAIENSKLVDTCDLWLDQIIGHGAQVTSQDEENVTITGKFSIDSEGMGTDVTEYSYKLTGVLSGHEEILGGITIKDYQVTEGADAASEPQSNVDYHKMAELCKTLIDQSHEGESSYYYVYDIDKDAVPEFILKEGTCEADFEQVIYKFDGKKMNEIGRTGGGHVSSLYGYENKPEMICVMAYMDYVAIWSYDLKKDTMIQDEIEVGFDNYETYIKKVLNSLSEKTYEIEYCEGTDTNSIYNNIMRTIE